MKQILHSTFYILHSARRGQALRLRSGQAMILAVLALGGAILGATTIAGLLMTYQIRQTTDAANSAKAIFAADMGLECGLYNRFKGGSCPLVGILSNGATYEVTMTASAILSKGTAATAKRAFFISL